MGDDIAAPLRDDWRSPLPKRLPSTDRERDTVLELHDNAMRRGMPTYLDPRSGFSVFTAEFLASRRYCCGSGCRHCPYEA